MSSAKEFPTAPAKLKGQTKKANRLPYADAAIKHTVQALTKELTFLCPVTGLVVPVGLPAFPGMVLESYHPIAHNGLSMLDLHPAYLDSLPKPALCAVFLAAMHALKKIEFIDGCSALLVNTAMQAALTKHQLLKSLAFINEGIRTTRKGYPPIRLNASLSEDTFNDYFNACVTLENYVLPTEEAAPRVVAPSFLSSSSQAKQLDKACYEAWLEVAPYLPKTTVAKAAPYIKSLASTPAASIGERLVARVIEYTCAEEYFRTNSGHLIAENGSLEKTLESNREYAAALAAYEFRACVATKREEARALGLHRDIFEADLGLTTDYDPPAPIASEAVDWDSPSPAPIAAVEKKMSFSERVAARKAGKL